MSRVLSLYRTVAPHPLGKRLFSAAFALKAPHVATVRPRFTVLEPDHAALVLANWFGVHNHLGTVHAIALSNGLEAAMGDGSRRTR